MSTTERVTVSCAHSHTVTLRLEEGEWRLNYLQVVLDGSEDEFYGYHEHGWTRLDGDEMPPAIRAELEAALAAADAACGGCGCAERLRAEAAKSWGATRQAVALEFAADFLDAAPDARGSDLSASESEGEGS